MTIRTTQMSTEPLCHKPLGCGRSTFYERCGWLARAKNFEVDFFAESFEIKCLTPDFRCGKPISSTPLARREVASVPREEVLLRVP